MYNIYFHEWPLVLFTILAQITAGLSLALLIYTKQETIPVKTMQKVSLILALMMGASILLSCFHLSNMFAGWNILFRMFSNALPLEVAMLSIFTALSGLLFLLIWKNKATEKHISLIIRLLPIFATLGLVFMALIYGNMSETVLSWNFYYAFGLFASVSLLLGGLAFPFMPLGDNKYAIGYKMTSVGLLLFIIILPLYMVFLGKAEPININNLFVMAPLYSCFLGTGLILTVVGFATMLFKGLNTTNIKAIFILVLIGQLLIRTLFYSLINTHLM